MQASDRENQFIHLVRLAWDLRTLHVTSSVELPKDKEPALLLGAESSAVKVRATKERGVWVFIWGRGPEQRVRALSEEAARTIQKAVYQ
ncbi:hypothetical protein GCM10022252_67740 [Streptosporangium oxazolinicum]|uniref:WYL domain-containing protein n=1 Tax=Streptosporangium oxazolinicum TaxID=909287 RepID=A0ABP8BGJ8_9ACTN